MDVTIPKHNVKSFAKALSALHKVGPHLILELSNIGFILRCLSVSQSSYAHFIFPYDFFTAWHVHDEALHAKMIKHNEDILRVLQQRQYEKQHPSANSSQPPAPLPAMRILSLVKCKLSIKPLLQPFKNYSNVQVLHITIDPATDSTTMVLVEDMTGIKRIYRYSMEDHAQIMQADFSRKQCTTHVAFAPKYLQQCLTSFATTMEEISIGMVDNTKISLKNYVPAAIQTLQQRALETEYNVMRRDLAEYELGDECRSRSITFVVRELKAMLALCHDLDYLFHVFVDRPARPILLTNSATPFDHLHAVQAALGQTPQLQPGVARFNADIVLATLQTEDNASQTQQSQQPAAPTPSPPSQPAPKPASKVQRQNFDSMESDLTTPPGPVSQHAQQSHYQSQHSQHQYQQQQQPRPPQPPPNGQVNSNATTQHISNKFTASNSPQFR